MRICRKIKARKLANPAIGKVENRKLEARERGESRILNKIILHQILTPILGRDTKAVVRGTGTTYILIVVA